MHRLACCRSIVLLILLLLLTPAIVRATPVRGSEPTVASLAGGNFSAWVRNVLHVLWAEAEVLTGDNGPGLDPNGRPTADNGPGLDPDGPF